MKFFLIIFFLIFFLVSCSYTEVNIDENFILNDGCLRYQYLDENISDYLSLGNNITVPMTYRYQDLFFNIIVIDRDFNYDIFHAKEVESLMRKAVIRRRDYDFLNSQVTLNDSSPKIAFDTYCFSALLFNDTPSAINVKNHVVNDTLLMEGTFTGKEMWAQISDETWCILLMHETNIDPDLVHDMVEKKIEQTDFYLESLDNINNSVVLIHMIMLLNEIPGFDEKYEYYTDYLYNLLEKSDVIVRNSILSNALYFLMDSKYKDPVKNKKILSIIKSRINNEGHILPRSDQNTTWCTGLTTIRTFMTLKKYEKNEK